MRSQPYTMTPGNFGMLRKEDIVFPREACQLVIPYQMVSQF